MAHNIMDFPKADYEILKEITKWPDETPNHTYVMIRNGKQAGKIAAYYKNHEELHVFKTPMKFTKSYRKFQK